MKHLAGLCAALLLLCLSSVVTLAEKPSAEAILNNWYRLVLTLVRHTPTYSPPVASRMFAYTGVTAYESVASGSPNLRTMAGQLHGLKALPKRVTNGPYNEAIVLNSALSFTVRHFFSNTGPTGQRVLAATVSKLDAATTENVDRKIVSRSKAYGEKLARAIWQWSLSDGGANITNLGFPEKYTSSRDKPNWVPTSTIRLQQNPLLPEWRKNRTFALPNGAACPLPPPPEYSEDPASQFYQQAKEVFDTKKNLTNEQRAIARFWSDDPMLSPTPPGHWISIAQQIFDRDHVTLEHRAETLMRMGIAAADAFIGCWHVKYQYNLLRPVTFIRRTIDPKWESTLITPPFPEYPSGHSTLSGAEAAVLTNIFGENFVFEDKTAQRDGLAPRSFSSFNAAAQEAALSRLYGGIHFRAAIEQGLVQGRCVAQFALSLQTKK